MGALKLQGYSFAAIVCLLGVITQRSHTEERVVEFA